MQLIFLNPWGWLALLGIPAVLLIHLLQRKARAIPITTLFLLEALPQQSAPGRRWERLRQSLPLWLQLLFVLLLTWLLVQPRLVNLQQVQRIAVVMDSSASMGAQREPTLDTLRRTLPSLARRAATTEWLLLESLPESDWRHRSTDLAQVLTELDGWQANAPSHDHERALRLARQLIGPGGLLLWVTDRPPESAPPHRAVVVSGAAPLDNVGLSGAGVEPAGSHPPRWRWSAVVHNHGDQPATRSWWIESADGQRLGDPRSLSIAADSLTRIEGEFPPGTERIVLCLEPDALAIDDRLPLVVPRPAPLPVWLAPELHRDDLPWQRLVASLEQAPLVDDPTLAVLRIARHDDPALGLDPPAASWRIATAPDSNGTWLTGDPVNDTHPLVEALSWQGLAFADTTGPERLQGDVPLLWMGSRCLLWLGGSRDRPSLNFDFDPGRSNADRLPALVVLAGRQIEALRNRSVGHSQANVEVRAPLPLGDARPAAAADWQWLDASGAPLDSLLRAADGRPLLRAPAEPGLFELRQGERALLRGAAQFTDLAQVDLRQAGPVDPSTDLALDTVERVRQQDSPLDWLWLALLAACLLLAWWWPNRRRRDPTTSPAQPLAMEVRP